MGKRIACVNISQRNSILIQVDWSMRVPAYYCILFGTFRPTSLCSAMAEVKFWRRQLPSTTRWPLSKLRRKCVSPPQTKRTPVGTRRLEVSGATGPTTPPDKWWNYWLSFTPLPTRGKRWVRCTPVVQRVFPCTSLVLKIECSKKLFKVKIS